MPPAPIQTAAPTLTTAALPVFPLAPVPPLTAITRASAVSRAVATQAETTQTAVAPTQTAAGQASWFADADAPTRLALYSLPPPRCFVVLFLFRCLPFACACFVSIYVNLSVKVFFFFFLDLLIMHLLDMPIVIFSSFQMGPSGFSSGPDLLGRRLVPNHDSPLVDTTRSASRHAAGLFLHVHSFIWCFLSDTHCLTSCCIAVSCFFSSCCMYIYIWP